MACYPHLRYIFGPARSGTSNFQRALCQAFNARGIYEPLRYEMYWHKKLDGKLLRSTDGSLCHEFMAQAAKDRKTVIAKDIIGYTLNNEIVAKLFEKQKAQATRPVFIFRKPEDAAASLKSMKWYPVEFFIQNYANTYEAYRNFKNNGFQVMATTHEQFIDDPDKVIEHVAKHWGIEVSSEDRQWDRDYFDLVHYEPKQKDEIMADGTHDTLLASKKMNRKIVSKAKCLTQDEVKEIRERLGPIYQSVRENRPTIL